MNLQKIGKLISIKRKEQGLTQEKLAEKLGVTNKAVSKWERGICLPDAVLFNPLCQILDISIGELLKGEVNISENNEDETTRLLIDLAKIIQKLKKLQNSILCFFVGIILNLLSNKLPDLLLVNQAMPKPFVQGLIDGIQTGLIFVGTILIVIGFSKYIANKYITTIK
ncbi:MAG: helix-turn-helix transcriptional regulator [Mobilitalea sp.]